MLCIALYRNSTKGLSRRRKRLYENPPQAPRTRTRRPRLQVSSHISPYSYFPSSTSTHISDLHLHLHLQIHSHTSTKLPLNLTFSPTNSLLTQQLTLYTKVSPLKVSCTGKVLPSPWLTLPLRPPLATSIDFHANCKIKYGKQQQSATARPSSSA